MPKGTSAPGNSPTVPGLTGPVARAVERMDEGRRVGAGGRRAAGSPRRARQAGERSRVASAPSTVQRRRGDDQRRRAGGDGPGRSSRTTVATGTAERTVGAVGRAGVACRSIRGSCHTPLPCSASWVRGRPARCSGSTSRRRGSTASTTCRCPTRWSRWSEGVVVRSWSGLIDPGRDDPAGGDRGPRHLDGAGPRRGHAAPSRRSRLVSDAVVAASARGVPLAGMKLDYDLTILETQARDLCRCGPRRAGMVRAGARRRRSSTATSTPTARAGGRSSTSARTTAIEIGNAHDASADAIASIEVLFALAVRYDDAVGVRSHAAPPRPDRLAPGVDGGLRLAGGWPRG